MLRRRLWLLIVPAFFGLVAAAMFFTGSPAPPYKFMKQWQCRYEGIKDGLAVYRLKANFPKLVKDAEKELKAQGLNKIWTYSCGMDRTAKPVAFGSGPWPSLPTVVALEGLCASQDDLWSNKQQDILVKIADRHEPTVWHRLLRVCGFA